MANNPPAKVREVAVPRVVDVTSSIIKPTIEGHFELKLPMIQLLHSSGRVTKEYVRLTLFPFSLLGNASNWLLAEPANSITSWDDLATKFLTRQKSGENLYQAWERFKGLLRDCPHHHQTNEVLVHTFIESLDAQHKSSLDTAAGGQALDLSYEELFTLLNRFTQSTPDWQDDAASSSVRKAPGVFEVDNFTTLSAQIDAMRTEIKKLTAAQAPLQVHAVQQAIIICEFCGEGHNNNQNRDLAVRNLERQIAGAQNTRPLGGLPSDTDVNPKPYNIVTLRNGRELEEATPKKTNRVEAEIEKITEEMIEEERVVKTPVAKQP
ncbi:uncharacterized protein LOC132044083 [Lycium ferocissimum]|uniref:uncharacterized protein LOC132044083 n=1 Tax=Lycium ferocissimum TaxID=112874 RepID=UPI002814C376|nr:uncharacterized protein LOC132044083 [Lycium ferocissimum]